MPANPAQNRLQNFWQELMRTYPELAILLWKLWKELQLSKENLPEWQHFYTELKELAKRYFAPLDDLDEFGCSTRFLQYTRPLFQYLYHHYFRVSVKGAALLPKHERVMVISNHSGVVPYDAAMLWLALFNETQESRQARFLVDDFVSCYPKLEKVLQLWGGSKASPENAEKLIERGHWLINFPEGTKGVGKPFEKRYQLERFGRGGFVRFAIKNKATLVPAAIVGAEEIHPLMHKTTSLAKPLGLPYIPVTPSFPLLGPLGLVPLPTKWTIVFGKPISFSSTKLADAENETLIAAQTEKIRTQIQGMLKQELQKRKNVWG